MARAETTAYRTERRKYITQPVQFLRFHYVRKAGDGTDYPFSRDFSTHAVLGATVEKLVCLPQDGLDGNEQGIDPIAGRTETGVLTARLVDINGEITRYCSDPAEPLMTAISSTGTPAFIEIRDARGYPSKGHVTIDNEDFRYTGTDTTTTPHRLTGITRAARDTVAAAHSAGTLVRNGEQIRRGARVTLFLGYHPLAEADYGPGPGYVKLEVTNVSYDGSSRRWIVQASDIRRSIKRTLFQAASQPAPVTLGPEHPITLALKVMLSTGKRTNGPYDVLPDDQGLGVPQQLVDVAAWEQIRESELPPGLLMEFRENAPRDGKEWIEGQIARLLNVLPVVNQRGQLSARRLGQPPFRRSGFGCANIAIREA